MAYGKTISRKTPERIDLEKKYGAVACKGLLNAAEFAKKQADTPHSKGFASQTNRKHNGKHF